MLQMTVIGKKSELPNTAKRTMTALTNRNGASLRRNCATGSASHRWRSSVEIAFADRPLASSARGDAANGIGTYDDGGTAYADASMPEGAMARAGAFGWEPALSDAAGLAAAGAARGAGAVRESSAATRAFASGNRL